MMSKRPTPNCGMTMVEVLVATVIVMVAVLSVSSVYLWAGKRTNRAIAVAEAARLAEAIRAYAFEELVDPGTGQVTDTTIDNNDVTSSSLVGQPDMVPTALIHTPVRLVWQLEVTTDVGGPDPGPGITRHIARARIAIDTERDETLSAGDEEIAAHIFYLFDIP